MKAHRGDLIVVETNRPDYVIGRDPLIEYEVGIVTNITRDGVVKRAKFRSDSDGIEIPAYWHVSRTFIVPQAEVSVSEAAAAAWANPWPAGQPGRPFYSLDDVKATIAPYKLSAAA